MGIINQAIDYIEKRHASELSVIRSWRDKHNIKEIVDEVDLALNIASTSDSRKIQWQNQLMTLRAVLHEEILCIDSILTLMRGHRAISSIKHEPESIHWDNLTDEMAIRSVKAFSEPLKSIKSKLVNSPDLEEELLKWRRMLFDYLMKVKMDKATSRKVLINSLSPIFSELDKRQITAKKQIEIVVELFIALGYENSKGKNDPKTVYRDVEQMQKVALYPI